MNEAESGTPPSGRGIVVACATLGPIGHLPAPGTWGSLVGIAWAAFLWLAPIPAAVSWTLVGLGLSIGIWICGEAEKRLGRRDPGIVILDEFASVPLCFLGWSRLENALPIWAVLLAGFAIFRVLDIGKPLGIRRLQDAPGGWGVMLDDVAAALLTAAILNGIAWLI